MMGLWSTKFQQNLISELVLIVRLCLSVYIFMIFFYSCFITNNNGLNLRFNWWVLGDTCLSCCNNKILINKIKSLKLAELFLIYIGAAVPLHMN